MSLKLSAPGCLMAVALLLASPRMAAAQGSAQPQAKGETPVVNIKHLSSPPRLEEFVAGRVPEDMTVIDTFLQREPRDGEAASRQTTAYLGYDDRNFYAVFVCKENQGAVRAHMSKRDAINSDDIVGVLIDSFHDHRHVYEFFVNPLGIQMDATSAEGQNDDYTFDTVWHSDGRLTPDGYMVLVSIPFRSIRFANVPVQQWGISLLRSIPASNELSFWPYMTRKVPTFADQLGHLNGMENISPGRNLQLIPYGAFTGSRFLDESAPAYGTKNEGRAGVDAKMVLRDSLTLDVAVNPDFSQVESDEPQVTVNQRFEVMFPEKRPFFLENSVYFKTPENLFFSRRIADPRFGGRLTGRVGKWNIAGLVMDDRAPGESVDKSSALYGETSLVAVGRVVREFARQSSVGFLVTDREFGSTFNRVASAEARLRLSDRWISNLQAVTSETRDASGASLSGQDFLGQISYGTRTVHFESQYRDVSPGFRSALGFIPRTDMREWSNYASYKVFPKGKTLLSWGPSVEGSVLWDHQQQLQEWEVSPEFQVELPRGSNLEAFASRSHELYEGIAFDKQSAGFSLSSDWFNWLSGSLSVHRGTGINYYPASGMTPFLANSAEVEAEFILKPTPGLGVSETYIFESLGTRAALSAAPVGTTVFRLRMMRTKANYQFTRAWSLRAIVDYSTIDPNAQLVTLDRDKRLTLDILATYLLNPGTALYIGVTDAYANLRLDPLVSPALQRTTSANTSTGRQFFVKMSYLLRF